MRQKRHDTLYAYFEEVIRDLAFRGVVRWKNGQPIDNILQREGMTVAKEVYEDVAEVLKAVGHNVLAPTANRLLGMGVDKVSEMLFGKRR